MGDVIIKNEQGKDVAYRQESFFGLVYDVKIGDLHDNFDGSKETRNSFNTNVRIERQGNFQFNERDGSVDGVEGKFSADRALGFKMTGYERFRPAKTVDASDDSRDMNPISRYEHSTTNTDTIDDRTQEDVKRPARPRFSSGDKYAMLGELCSLFSKSLGVRIFRVASQIYEDEKNHHSAAAYAERVSDFTRTIELQVKEGLTNGDFAQAERSAKSHGLEKVLLQAYKNNHLHIEAAKVAANSGLVDEAAEHFTVALHLADDVESAISISLEAVKTFHDINDIRNVRRFCNEGIRFADSGKSRNGLAARMLYQHMLSELDKKK